MGIEAEEVAPQQDRDAQEELSVDAVAVEDAIAGHAACTQLSAEPCNGTPLLDEFLMDFLPYVDVVGHDGGVSVWLFSRLQWHDKRREVVSLVCLYQTSGSGKPFPHISTNFLTPK